jgi:hypothetical protein
MDLINYINCTYILKLIIYNLDNIYTYIFIYKHRSTFLYKYIYTTFFLNMTNYY